MYVGPSPTEQRVDRVTTEASSTLGMKRDLGLIRRIQTLLFIVFKAMVLAIGQAAFLALGLSPGGSKGPVLGFHELKHMTCNHVAGGLKSHSDSGRTK